MTKSKQISTQLIRQIRIEWYWLIPLFLWGVQVWFTVTSRSQILFEELNESVRNVYWLDQGMVYDGISRNVGWYATLLGIYRWLGFGLFTAKYFRLGLTLVSLYAMAMILRRYMGKAAWSPLIVWGLSPVWLTLSSRQAQYGLEWQYLPIYIALVMYVGRWRGWWFVAGMGLAGMFWGVGLLSYASLLLYLPALIYGWWMMGRMRKKWILGMVVQLVGMILPFVLSYRSISNRQLLVYDPVTQASFVSVDKLDFSGAGFKDNWLKVYRDLFVTGNSYHFQLPKPDFSDGWPIITWVAMLLVIIWTKKTVIKEWRMLAFILLPGLVAGVIVVSLLPADSLVGGRKVTPMLWSFYGLYALGWKWLVELSQFDKLKGWLMAAMLTLPLHHLIVIPANLTNYGEPNFYHYDLWWGERYGTSPTEAFGVYTSKIVTHDLHLRCDNLSVREVRGCRYGELYAAMRGFCEWNRQPCHAIYGYDDRIGREVELTPDLWSDYYFVH